jgi:hypothetical protein
MRRFGYPKYGKSQSLGQVGESFIDSFVHQKLGWIYRSIHQESDFGIDGYIDIVTDENVTGQTIGIQIKCGDSYFNKRTGGGIRYEGETKHLNYYLNCLFPIIFVVLNGNCSEGKWVEFNANITSPSKSGWWIEIPDKNALDMSVKDDWELFAGPVSDNSEKIALSWQVNNMIDESDFGVYVVQKDDVLACDFTGLIDVIDRLSRNRESLLKNRGTLEVLIEGYDEDNREAYEIPEIRHWYSESINAGIPWFYFLGEHSNGMGLIVLLFSNCDIEVKFEKSGNTYVDIADVEQIVEWLNKNYNNLNIFTEDKDIPSEINKEMSERAYSLVSGHFVELKG